MANLNKVMLIGRLTRDPETRSFANGGKVVKFGFAVNNYKKNPQTGERIEEAVFVDCEAFSGEFNKTGDLVEKYLRKGSQAYLEGHLKLDQWEDKTTGAKRSALRLVVDNLQLLDRRQDGSGGGTSDDQSTRAPAKAMQQPVTQGNYESGPADEGPPAGDDSIPF